MTGYGESRLKLGAHTLLCRAKSVNHRFLDVKVRLPRPDLISLDMGARKLVSEHLRRGAVELTVSLEQGAERADELFNTELAKSYLAGLKTFSKKAGLRGTLSLDSLLRLPGIVVSASGNSSGAALENLFSAGNDEKVLTGLILPAIRALQASRTKEGALLTKHLLALLDQMDSHAAAIAELEVPEKDRARNTLIERAQKTLEFLFQASPEALGLSKPTEGAPAKATEEFSRRLHEEAVFWIERRDFEEERIRLGIHLQDFRKMLLEPLSHPDGLGRRLEFLQQEILREVNTLGTKSQSTAITKHTIELKTILERIKEQLANVA